MRGFLCLTAIFCIAFSAAVAEQSRIYRDGSHISIQATNYPGARAEVVFHNLNVHSVLAEEFTLTLGDITVGVLFERDITYSADDRFTVTPPAGFIAVPPALVVPENGTGIILIYEEIVG